jgi:hypothetical protein
VEAEDFEESYNHRFEEPGGAAIVSHARNVPPPRTANSVSLPVPPPSRYSHARTHTHARTNAYARVDHSMACCL